MAELLVRDEATFVSSLRQVIQEHVRLAVEEEREACAKVAEKVGEGCGYDGGSCCCEKCCAANPKTVASEIRARSHSPKTGA